ncbi:MAG: pyridoxine 5'-phosphate synthase [Betaproteobacteria bacterium]|nr:pyridoxine 5'-phosphate synthase [Betaproteobacteria bacterium]
MRPAASPPPCALSVNLNKVALLRNSRHLGIPSVLRAAQACLQAGAHGITVHPRPDERHIRRHDVFELAELLQGWPQREYNIEGNPFHNLLEVARELRARGLPLHQLTFVPDSVGQYTSDHGWSLPADAERLRPVIAQAQALGARVSLFMDAEPEQMAAARALGADRVELYTEPYAAAHAAAYGAAHTAAYGAAKVVTGAAAQTQHRDGHVLLANAADAAAGTHCPPRSAATPNATASPALRAQLQRYTAAAQAALDAGLEVNAGHDLNRANLSDFLRQVPGVREVSIGHALIADALELGYSATVRDYLRCIEEAAATQASPAAPATPRP